MTLLFRLTHGDSCKVQNLVLVVPRPPGLVCGVGGVVTGGAWYPLTSFATAEYHGSPPKTGSTSRSLLLIYLFLRPAGPLRQDRLETAQKETNLLPLKAKREQRLLLPCILGAQTSIMGIILIFKEFVKFSHE